MDDSYAGQDLLSGDSFIPAIGMSVELTQTILALHTIWSICVPITIVETFVSHRRTDPWLGRVGLTVVGVVYALGAGLVFWGNYYEERFWRRRGWRGSGSSSWLWSWPRI